MSQKRPLHEVLSSKLVTAPVGIKSDLASAKAAEVMTILDALQRGKMKAADAHKIAEDHAGLPELLKSAGQLHLAEFAEEVLNDLRGREDEKKSEEDAQSEVAVADAQGRY